ncbi:PREDICTED: galactosylceramide sulfotransferase-like [Branchiostoma belcheri]|uniref:Galactosylceramide sulfotransferase-like n=1 Tax=Branchiostoma belcheri TaxID=7741 RepID=A0A6P4XSN1_BRABE|nr:PREDICTED: galactosylceramide sulfotransferase-like [Branchiostoma belcheri]
MICKRKLSSVFVAILVCGGFSYYISTNMRTPEHQKIRNRISPTQESRREVAGRAGTCTPRRKFVFIATHKTGTVTTSNVFQRYAIIHKLPVLIPKSGNPISWGLPPDEDDYIHTPDEQYGALWNHMRYNKEWLRSKFPADTAYFSIIRNPANHLISAMNYYSLPQLLKLRDVINPVNEFSTNPWKYKNLSEVYFGFCNITWDPTRNFIAFDLGYPAEGAENEVLARQYISELETDFTLIMLLEYLDESLVLLKRLMCWELKDVLYVVKNNRTYTYKMYTPSEEQISNLRKWKAVDYLLYETFNTSLWRKIGAQGPDFHEEVFHFKKMNRDVNTYCLAYGRWEGAPNLTVAASKWNHQFEVDAVFCRLIQSVVSQLMGQLRRGQEGGRTILSEKVNIRAVMKGEPTFKYKIERDIYLEMVNKHEAGQ